MKLVGHENIRKFLEKSLANDRLAHAYIFNGPKGIGKTSVLEELISKLKVSKSDYIELRKPEDKKSISVEQVRELKERLSLTAFGGYKVAVIFEGHELNAAASNALLKLLEEPTPKTILFLLTDRSLQLLETIRSRAITINFSPLDSKELKELAKLNGYSGSHGELENLYSYSQGLPGLLISLMQNSQEFDTIKARISSLVEALTGTLTKKTLYCQSVEEKSILLGDLADVLRDLFLLSNNQPEKIRNRFAQKELTVLAEKISASQLISATSLLLREQEFSAYNANKNLYFETIISQL